jgi:hypothetical protein
VPNRQPHIDCARQKRGLAIVRSHSTSRMVSDLAQSGYQESNLRYSKETDGQVSQRRAWRWQILIPILGMQENP